MSRKRPHSQISTSTPSHPPVPPLPDIGPLSPNSSDPLQCFFGAESLNLINEEANDWQAFFNGISQPLPDFDFGADLDMDMLDLPDPVDFGVDFDTVLPGFGGAGELTLNAVGEEENGNENGNGCLDGALTGVGDSGMLPAASETAGGSIGIPGDGVIEVEHLVDERINQPRIPSFPERVYTENCGSASHPPGGSSCRPGGLLEGAPETGAGVRIPTNNPSNLTEAPQSTRRCTTERVPSNPNPAKRPLPSPELEQEEEIPIKKKKRLRRKKDQPEPDYSAIIRLQVKNATRTGQACDRCKVKRMKCDSNPKTCLNCRIYHHKCKTTDLTTGITSTRGEITEVKQDLKIYEREIEELEMENDALKDEVESLRAILGQAGLIYKGYQVGYVRGCGCLCPLHAFPPSSARRRGRFRAHLQTLSQYQPQFHPQHQHQPPLQSIPYPHPETHHQRQARPNQAMTIPGYGYNPTFFPQNNQIEPPPSRPPPPIPVPIPISTPSHTPTRTAPQNITTESNPTAHRPQPLPHHYNIPNPNPLLPNQPNSNPNINRILGQSQKTLYGPSASIDGGLSHQQQQQERPREKVSHRQQLGSRKQADYIPTDDYLYLAQTAQMPSRPGVWTGCAGGYMGNVDDPGNGMGQDLGMEIPTGSQLGEQ